MVSGMHNLSMIRYYRDVDVNFEDLFLTVHVPVKDGKIPFKRDDFYING